MGIYTPKSVQVNFLWGKNNVRTATEPKFYIPPKQIYGYAPRRGVVVSPLSSINVDMAWRKILKWLLILSCWKIKSYVNLYSGVSDKSLQGRCTTATTGKNDAGVAPVSRQPQGPPNGCQHTQHRPCGALYPQPKPVPIYILLGEQRHMCVNNLPRVAPSGGTAGNRTRNLSITNPTPYHYTTKPRRRPVTETWRTVPKPLKLVF